MELVTRPGRNRAVACLGEEKIFEYIALVFFLTLMGWLCHAVYYRTGHPWADINGPTVEDGGIHIPVHHWGTESVLSCGIRSVLFTYKLHEPCDFKNKIPSYTLDKRYFGAPDGHLKCSNYGAS